jgi:hypothetical protein
MIIEEQPTWQIIDSSKLDTYLDCPRKYFFEHMLGWRVDRPAHDLWFGESWHRAREYQLLNGYFEIQGAFDTFMNYYRQEFDPETDELYTPKDPMGVLNALIKFSEERQKDLIENEVLFTEISGTVPIAADRVIHYRMDTIMRRKEDGKIFSWDHKSAKRFSRQWSEKFHLSVQNGTYTHCLYCLYPIEDVLGVEFCGTAFEYLKKGSKDRSAGYHASFLRVPAFKTPDQMNVWLWTVNHYIDEIESEMGRLDNCKLDDPVLMAFPMNTNSCTKYWGCAFHDYCISWPNPLQKCEEPPLGFRTEFWDPSAMDTRNKMNLEWRT